MSAGPGGSTAPGEDPVRRTWQVPATAVVSLLAALTGRVTLVAWGTLYASPSEFLSPLFLTGLSVAGIGMTTRSARWPPAATVLAQLVVVLALLVRTYASTEAWAGWLPTPSALSLLARELNDGMLAAQAFQAPVPASAPEFAVVMAGGGCLVLVALDLVACGLRRPPLAGLPLLMVYVIPLSVPSGSVHWLVFVASATAFLLLVSTAEAERLAAWGRTFAPSERTAGGVVRSRGPSVSPRSVRESARRIGLATTALAVVLPALVPSLHWTPFGGGGGDGDGAGLRLSNPLVDLRRDLVRGVDTDLVTVRTDGPVPSYLRLTVLDQFDGQTWRPSRREIPVDQRADGELKPAPGLARTTPRTVVSETISTSTSFRSTWMPLSYPATFADVPGDWRYDRTTYDLTSGRRDQRSGGLTYRTRTLDLEPEPAQLDAAESAPVDIYTPGVELPTQFPLSVTALARRVTRDAESDYAQALALQHWFRDSGLFRYSLDQAPGNGSSDLADFLSPRGRVGYCEQFAASMAVMARSLGIPARVAVGFLHSTPTGDGAYVFSSHDLHAWPELYFEGTGWLRFEPTPAIRTGRAPGYARGTIAPAAPEPVPSTSAGAQQPRSKKVDNAARGDRSPTATGRARDGGTPWRRYVVGMVLLLLVGLALAPRVVRRRRRRLRTDAEHDPVVVAAAVWAELEDTCVDLGVPWRAGASVRETARGLLLWISGRRRPRPGEGAGAVDDLVGAAPEALGEVRAALERLVRFVEQARYARVPSFPVEGRQQVETDLEVLLAALRDASADSEVRRAEWAPRSVLSRGVAGWRTPPVPVARTDADGARVADTGESAAEVDRVSTGG